MKLVIGFDKKDVEIKDIRTAQEHLITGKLELEDIKLIDAIISAVCTKENRYLYENLSH